MLSSGIKKLDELLGGGVEEGRAILIETISGLGDLLALSFVAESLKRREKCFVILGRKRIRDIRKFFEDRGVDTSNLTIITTYEKSKKKLNLDELFLISHTIKELAKTTKFGSIDILQPLLILYDPRKIYSLLSEIVGILKDSNVTTVLTVDKRLVDNRTLAMFEELVDVVIELEEVVDNLKVRRGIRIKKNSLSPPTHFYSLKIDKNGFEIGEKIE